MPNDHASPSRTDAKPAALDTTVIPLGERAWQSILDHVIAVGDEAEATYLEVKSSLDLSSKTGVAKVAKFLLGAANRRPHEAARHFQGYGVLLIGAQRDKALGVPRGVEAHELEDRLRPYLGSQFPAFEFGRIGVDADHEVLFIIAQPPRDGQPPFPCHKTFQGEDRRDSLENGAIYVRGTSNTRPAHAGEIQALVERARGGGKPPIELEVEVLGSASRVDHVDDMMERLYMAEEERFSKPPQPATDTSPSVLLLASTLYGGSKPLSAEDRAARLEEWRKEKPAHIAQGREHFLGVVLKGLGIRVVSRDRFVAKPHLTVTFHNCEAFDYLDAEDANLDKVLESVVRRQSLYGAGMDLSGYRAVPSGYAVDWKNHGDDVEVTLTPESFRPNVPWATDQDDYVILARDPQASSVSATWVLTEDGNDAVTEGALKVPTSEYADAVDLLRAMFFKER